MSISKKRQKVTYYCQTTDCNTCVLRGQWEHQFGAKGLETCLDIGAADESELDDAIQLISGNPYWFRISQMAERQRAKGIAAYGQGLEDNTQPDALTRIEYIQEELIDGLMYLEWLKEKMKDVIKDAAEKDY